VNQAAPALTRKGKGTPCRDHNRGERKSSTVRILKMKGEGNGAAEFPPEIMKKTKTWGFQGSGDRAVLRRDPFIGGECCYPKDGGNKGKMEREGGLVS